MVGIGSELGRIIEDSERIARGLVRLAQSYRQLCADFLRDHRDGMDTPAVAKFAARIRMFDRVIASASLAQVPNAPTYAQNGQQNRQVQTQRAQSGQAAHGYGVYSTQSSRGTWLFPPNANQGGNS